MTKSILWALFAVLIVLAGCGAPEHPAEDEVKGKLLGSYCSDEYKNRLEINPDGRYVSKRSKKSPFGNPITEKCEGTWSLKYDDGGNVWTLEMAASDKSSNPFVKCKAASIEVWKGEGGWVVGENPVKLVEPFDQQVVESNKCGDI